MEFFLRQILFAILQRHRDAILWAAMICMLLLSLGNSDAARNLIGGVLGLIGLVCLIQGRALGVARWTVNLYLLFCCASAFWALLPAATLSNFLSQALMPLSCFALMAHLMGGASDSVRSLWATRFVLTGVLSMALLTIIGAVNHFSLLPALQPFAQHYWPGVGEASTIVAFWFVVALWFLSAESGNQKRLGVLLAVLCLAAASIEANRAVWISCALAALVIASVWVCRRFSLRRRPWVAVMLAIFFAALAAGFIAYQTLKVKPAAGITGSGLVDSFAAMVAKDPRVQFWPIWAKVADAAGWFGFGFGQKNVDASRSLLDQAAVVAIDPLGTIHPHNIFMNYMIQIGTIGLLLFLALMASILFQAFRNAQVPSQSRVKRMDCAVVCLVLLIVYLQKNTTDIWTQYGPQLLFWMLLGLMLGFTQAPDKFQDSA